MKAMILAAGKGERLGPLTQELPKPLIPVANRPLIEYNLDLLKRHGITEVAVNLHHMGEKIRDHLGNGHRFGLQIHYSPEEVLLGTGGGIKKLRTFFGSEPFLVINADILIDIDLKDLILFHRSRSAFATMVLRPNPDPVRYGTIETDDTGRIREFLGKLRTQIRNLRKWMFTGIHLFHPSIFDTLPGKDAFCINRDVYAHWIRSGMACYGYVYRGYWKDLGIHQEYLQANMDLLHGETTGQETPCRKADDSRVAEGAALTPPFLIGRGSIIAEDTEIGPYAVIGEDCKVGRGAKITQSLLWAGAEVEAGETIRKMIVTRYQRIKVPESVDISQKNCVKTHAPQRVG
jgi:NDP-sugar pyrophosphorylase family protein